MVHVKYMGEERNAYRVSAGKTEGKRQLTKQRHRWGDNIKTNLKGIGS